MNILFVVNNIYLKGNGLSESARKTAQALKKRGFGVRTLSCGTGEGGETPDYALQDFTVPVFHAIIQKQGYQFAKVNKELVKESVRWADVIHIEEPFPLQEAVCEAAEKLKKPCVGTYHLHPENLSSSVYLRKDPLLNKMLMLAWRNRVFDKCEILQCPSENVKERLTRWKFKSELRVISNGIEPVGRGGSKIERSADDIYRVICVGRFSREKKQKTLLKSMRYSKYAPKIQLYFAGRGPTEKSLKRFASKLVKRGVLKLNPSFKFYSRAQLRELYRIADLYVHCAIIEVEGLSCMEASAAGVLPIIAAGRHTAASQFALDERQIFKAGDARRLAARIDYWLSRGEERTAQSERCAAIENVYGFDESIDALIQMYKDAVARA